MKTVVIRFQIQRLLADLLDGGLGSQRQIRDLQRRFAGAAGLRKNRVGFAVHFLQQKVELLADFAAGVSRIVKLAGVNLQPGDLFADITAVGQDRRFLGQPLRFDLDSLGDFLQPWPAASRNIPMRPREAVPCVRLRHLGAGCGLAVRPHFASLAGAEFVEFIQGRSERRV